MLEVARVTIQPLRRELRIRDPSPYLARVSDPVESTGRRSSAAPGDLGRASGEVVRLATAVLALSIRNPDVVTVPLGTQVTRPGRRQETLWQMHRFRQ
jgi:hypothetical protein